MLSRSWWSGALLWSVTGCFADAPTAGSSADDPSTSTSGEPSAQTQSSADSGTGSGSEPADCPPQFVCAAAVPAGWQGPATRFTGVSAPLPQCPDDYPFDEISAGSGPSAAAVTCSSCTCSEPTGVECQGPAIELFNADTCESQPIVRQLEDHLVCTPLPGIFTAIEGLISEPILPIPGSGACTPDGGDIDAPDTSWDQRLRICGGAPTAGGCEDDGACVPAPDSSLAPGLCIFTDDDVACPDGPYSQRNLFFQGLDDSRECTECTCGAPTQTICFADIDMYNDDACRSWRTAVQQVAPNVCYDISVFNGGHPGSARLDVFDTEGGSCIANGGVPVGAVVPIDPVTVCCTA